MCLYLLIFLPLLGGIFSWVSEKINKKLPCLVSLFFIFSMFLLTLKIFFKNRITLYKNIDLSTLWDKEYCISWISSLGVSFHLGIDGISFLMIFLTIFLSFISILLTWNEDIKKNGFFYFCMMLIISNMMGIFLSLDLFLFFIFWEIIIIPTYFLVLFYGKYNKFSLKQLNSSNSYLIYSQLSGLILLVSILTLVFNYYQQYHIFTFDFNLLKNISLDKNTEIFLMIGFFLSFVIKVPLIPFHSWFPNFHKNTHISGAFDLIGIVIKIAIYSLFRFNIFLFPKMSTYYSTIFCIFGLFSIFYSLFIMFSQKNIKKIISYMSISHMGFILIAMYSGSYIAYQGMIIQMISSSISTSALIILTKILYKNFKTYNLNKMIGLWKVMFYVPGFFLFFIMASLGIPGTGNFIGEFLILLGSFKFFPIIIILSMISIIFLSFCLLNFFHKIFYGFCNTTLLVYKISILEIFILFILAFILIFIGLYPNIILKIANQSIFNVSKRISPFILN
ncbi:MAG: NADH-quinone oxidoreductase subunit M [Buchnera aphidicola (Periphyllus acericola)]|uniref:complex I subunit 4 family protein n=1 Tax=Buchnera aphidicola TaxID=9 RepID=UPI0030CAB8EF|nr:NADH-quinone oxidoreductase subunit M [Buchnera aphidicola (Periphyllus acericola)]